MIQCRYNVIIIGWGSETFRGPSSRVLREVNMRVWENGDCQKVFDNLRTIYSTMMCAGGKSGMDTCQVISDRKSVIKAVLKTILFTTSCGM